MSVRARREWLDRVQLLSVLDTVEGEFDPLSNFGYSTVQIGSTIIGSTAAVRTIVLGTAEGAAFPTGDAVAQFNVVVWPAGVRPLKTNAEIVRVTRAGDTLTTVARGQEGTAALATVAAGHQVMAAVTAKTVTDLQADLAYAEFTSNVTVSATAEGSANTIVTAPAFTADGLTPVWIEFFCPNASHSDAESFIFSLFEDGSAIGQLAIVQSNTTSEDNINGRRKRTPAAGSRTYSVRGYMSASTSSGTARANSGGAGNLVPGFIRVRRA